MKYLNLNPHMSYNKIIFTFLFLSLFPFLGMAQETPEDSLSTSLRPGKKRAFSNVTMLHAFGASYHGYEYYNDISRKNETSWLGGITYLPRFNVMELKKEVSVSIGVPISLGFQASPFGTYFLFDSNISADFNVGHFATLNGNIPIGAFGGAGIDFNYLNVDGYRFQIGPVFSGGLRFNLGGRSMTIRYAQTQSLTQLGSKLSSISILSNIF